jgi:hypothetical protein
LRTKWLEELAPLLKNARACDPPRPPGRRGPAPSLSQQRSLIRGERYGWNCDVVAAVFLLTGVKRGDFSHLRDSVRELDRRRLMKLSLVPADPM